MRASDRLRIMVPRACRFIFFGRLRSASGHPGSKPFDGGNQFVDVDRFRQITVHPGFQAAFAIAGQADPESWEGEREVDFFDAKGDLEVDAVVGEGPLSKDVIRRSDTEGYATQGP